MWRAARLCKFDKRALRARLGRSGGRMGSGVPAAVRGKKPKQAMITWLKKNGEFTSLLMERDMDVDEAELLSANTPNLGTTTPKLGIAPLPSQHSARRHTSIRLIEFCGMGGQLNFRPHIMHLIHAPSTPPGLLAAINYPCDKLASTCPPPRGHDL
ncbi:hypothetical protein [Achromobacter spanius]|uniref:hypothetical protein n=1 Tax=Achromobacter spanius TaxID=217203 RepID=UPI003F6929AF